MSEPKFTPGPWTVKNDYQVVRDAGYPLPRIVVETTISGECGQYPGNADEANAHLIAAAPDLYAACEEFVRKVEAGEARSTRSYTAMKAALSKARGEDSDGHT